MPSLRPRSAFVALALCAHCVTTGPSTATLAPAEAPHAFVIATYNVNFAIPQDAPTIRAVRELDADVLLLQETSPEWQASLTPWIREQRLHSRFWHSDRFPAGGAGVVSRWPIRDEVSVDSAVDWFQAHRFIADSPCGPIELVNVHLQPPISDGSVVRGWFDAPSQHEREITRVFERVDTAAQRPLIIAGDFNEPEDRGAVAWLNRHRRLTSALPGFQPNATTWHWPVGPIELEQRLDHVMYNPRAMRAIDARVIYAGNSDHRPVRAVFRWQRACPALRP